MKSKRFFGMFPAPQALQMSAVGIDISDRSFKFFQLIEKNGLLIDGLWENIELPAGVVEGGRIVQADKVKTIINSLAKKYGFTKAIVSLPEDRAYTLQLSLPAMKKSEIRTAIAFQLEEYVPLPPDSIVFDYDLIKTDKKSQEISVVVSVLPKDIVDEYLAVFAGTKISPVAFEIEALAMSRSLLTRGSREVALIVDIGRVHAGFFIARHNEVLFTSIINGIGGDDVTAIVARQLNISIVEAEQKKNELGLNRSDKNKDSFFAVLPTITAIKDEITQRINYWHGREEGAEHQDRITRIVLCGGQSVLPGLVDFLQSYFDLPVEIGNPWKNFYPAVSLAVG